jgi:lysophospholipase L1-like esterase
MQFAQICLVLFFGWLNPASLASAQSVTGLIRDWDCAPIPGATVKLTGDSTQRETITPPDGSFSFTNLTGRRYSLRVEIGGFHALALAEVSPADAASPLKLGLALDDATFAEVARDTDAVIPHLKKGARRLIRVMDEDCQPITGARITITGRTGWNGLTDAGGLSLLPAFRSGNYSVRVSADGRSTAVLPWVRLPFRDVDTLPVALRRAPEAIDVLGLSEYNNMKPPRPIVFVQPGTRLRIVAMGDSTTAGTPAFKSPREAPPNGSGDETSQYPYWLMKAHPDWEVVNQGINAQRSDVIAARFDDDVVAKKPIVVVIIAGVNDVYQGRPAQHVKDQLAAMYKRAHDAGIRVVAGTIIPYNTATADQNARMHDINDWIRTQGRADPGVIYVDTRAAVAAPGDPDKLASSPDGLHPDAAGYRKMADAIRPAIEQALR